MTIYTVDLKPLLDDLDDLLVKVKNNDMGGAMQTIGYMRLRILTTPPVATSDELPEPKPFPGKSEPPKVKYLKTKQVECPTCYAKPGDPCYEMTTRGQHGKPTDVPRKAGSYHTARTKAAMKKAGKR